MLTFNDWLNEDAADDAKKAGLKSAGFGRWKDSKGVIVAKTVDGKLEKVRRDDEVKKDKEKPVVSDKKIDSPNDALADDGVSADKKIDALMTKIDNLEKNIKGVSASSEKSNVGVPEKAREKVNTLLKRLKIMSDIASANGERAPNYDLCKVSVPGTNLFCDDNVGIPRAKMPQLKGKAAPGTKAARVADADGSADAEEAFKKHLKDKGVKMENKKIPAASLKASQTQLVGAKVAGMLDALKKNPNHKGIRAPIFVSKDGYVVDGHHRWAAIVGLSLNDDKPVEMDVIQVDMSIRDVLKATNDFAKDFGIQQKDAE